LAVLASLQRSALGDVGAGVVQRYYAAASQTPGLILGRLVANARNHLGKLDAGLAWWYEERVADVMSHLGDRAPRILDLEGQGLFALGYYQQLAALRAGRKGGSDHQKQSDEQPADAEPSQDIANAQGELL
jgi:CRISPR-associated protein Csd1